ncbi:hypothetical protein DXG01_009779 [Tephrocybe rancida]|nr:hypothetical protein DXG01_009779 [Tephrocybe rancida]
MVSYLAIIDAGVLATRVRVFQWDGSTNPSTPLEVNLGNDAAHLVSSPGLHAAGDQLKIAVHLSPILSWMKKFFQGRNAPSRATPVHIFFLGSALRHISSTTAAPLLQHAYGVIESVCASGFNIGTQATNALIPTEAIMGAFAWAGLVYSRHTHGARPITDIPEHPDRHMNAVRTGSRVVLRLEHREWGTDFPLLSSSPWEIGAAALIIRNGISLAPATLANADRLPPFEFAVSGLVHVENNNVAPIQPSGQAPLLHQIQHHREREAQGQQGTSGSARGAAQSSDSHPTTEQLLNAAKIATEKLEGWNIKHAFVGGFAMGRAFEQEGKDKKFLALKEKREAIRSAVDAGSPDNGRLATIQGISIIIDYLLDDTNLGLPLVSDATMVEKRQGFCVLKPQILLLSKFQRWDRNYDSKSTKLMETHAKDAKDIDDLLNYLDKPQWRGVFSFQTYKSCVPNIRVTLLRITSNFLLAKSKADLAKVLPVFEALLVPQDLTDLREQMTKGIQKK